MRSKYAAEAARINQSLLAKQTVAEKAPVEPSEKDTGRLSGTQKPETKDPESHGSQV